MQTYLKIIIYIDYNIYMYIYIRREREREKDLWWISLVHPSNMAAISGQTSSAFYLKQEEIFHICGIQKVTFRTIVLGERKTIKRLVIWALCSNKFINSLVS